jgi:exosortase/archaeosortase family protein
MLSTRLFLTAQIATFWSVWLWYISRMLDGSDEPWGIIALLTVSFLVFKKGVWAMPTPSALVIASAIALIYSLSYGFTPPLIRGGLAVIAIGFSISAICYGRTIQTGIIGLMLLSLPLIASLQFYGGFPIRVITAYVSSFLLGLFGYSVQPQGTLLYWLGEVVAVDAPCAGIKMLWTGLYLNFTLAAWRELNFLTTWLSTSFTLFSVFIGNIFRATLLFFTESGIIDAPDFAHQTIGLIVFAIVATAVFSFHTINQGRSSCAI